MEEEIEAGTGALPETVISFHEYFRRNVDAEVLAGAFGYGYERLNVSLPRNPTPDWYEEIFNRLSATLPLVRWSSEARRDFLIAPLLQEFMVRHRLKTRIEYPLSVSDRLRGSLDFVVWGKQNLLVIEARNADMERAFSQLVAEMIALTQADEVREGLLYGAVSIGTLWQFAVLHTVDKKITQDLTTYRVPEDLRDVLEVLSAVLVGTAPLRTE